MTNLFLRVFTLSPRHLRILHPVSYVAVVVGGVYVGEKILHGLGVQ